jgi:hypothetical protein
MANIEQQHPSFASSMHAAALLSAILSATALAPAHA